MLAQARLPASKPCRRWRRTTEMRRRARGRGTRVAAARRGALTSRMAAVPAIIRQSAAKSTRLIERKLLIRSVSEPIRRHQVAGALAAEELDGEARQVLVGPVAQVGGDPLAHPGHDETAGPGKQPGDERGGEHQAEIPPDEVERDVGPPRLAGDQHIVDQGLRQVGGDQARGRAGDRQQEPQHDRPGPASGQGDQAQEGGSRLRGRRGRAAGRAIELVGRQHRPAAGADRRGRPGRVEMAVAPVGLEPIGQALGLFRPGGGVAPVVEPALVAEQLDPSQPGTLARPQGGRTLERPGPPGQLRPARVGGPAREDAAVGQEDEPLGIPQAILQVRREAGQHRLARLQTPTNLLATGRGDQLPGIRRHIQGRTLRFRRRATVRHGPQRPAIHEPVILGPHPDLTRADLVDPGEIRGREVRLNPPRTVSGGLLA